MFRSSGRLVYDPQFDNQRETKPFWLMLTCDEELAAYYRQLLFKERCIKLNPRCIWGAHISVIRGEKPLTGWWGKNKGLELDFEFDGIVRDDGRYYWMDVVAPQLAAIRVSYGLSPAPYFNFHLTIGNSIFDK